MSLVLVPVVVSLLVAAVAGGFAGVRFLALKRGAGAAASALEEGVDHVSRGADRAASHAERLSGGSVELEASVQRLNESRRRLAILLAAWAEARTALGRLVFVPRK